MIKELELNGKKFLSIDGKYYAIPNKEDCTAFIESIEVRMLCDVLFMTLQAAQTKTDKHIHLRHEYMRLCREIHEHAKQKIDEYFKIGKM